MKFSKNIILGLAITLVVISIIYFGFNTIQDKPTQNDTVIQEELGNSTNTKLIKWGSGSLFDIFVDPNDIVIIEGKRIPMKATFELKPNFSEVYSEIGVYEKENKPLIIIPIYTASAYAKNGFYDFYNGRCNTCITTKIVSFNELGEQSSANGVKILKLLGYDSITDIELDTNPSILSKYDKIIVLHNEYVTKKMFDAITSHPNVIYLYPNALYAEISTNFANNTITLIRGHNYPDENITNGFDWEFENTQPYEYDKECNNWEFYDIPNGKMLNCYPEQKIWKDKEFLRALKEL
ncbi:MAG: hypothetical protein ACE5R5_06620 [Nitrosarchaeum sp.]